MFPANFGYVAAGSVEEAVEFLTKYGDDAKLLARVAKRTASRTDIDPTTGAELGAGKTNGNAPRH